MEIEQLIKWILGILVIVVVIIAVGFFFKDRVIDFFRNFVGNETTNVAWGLLRGV